jgi:multimeric flavodoxin WrbA
MTTILGFNGSPRPTWTTSQLVRKALEGAASLGARTEYFDLNALNFKACQSCLICKRGAQHEGKCHFQDGLTPILAKVKKCDGFIVGFSVYGGLLSALSYAFLERLLYSNRVYRKEVTVFGRRIRTGLVVATGAPEAVVRPDYGAMLAHLTGLLGGVFGSCEWIGHHDAQQVEDYGQYDIQVCVPAEKIRHRKEQFPVDLQKAFELGKRVASK